MIEIFKSYSRNLNDFLRKEGIFFVEEGVHKTGVSISLDNGETWTGYTSIIKALDDHYQLFQREELEGFRDASINADSFIRTGKFVSSNGEKGKEVLVRKRIRYYKGFEVNDRLQTALARWKESGPSANK